MDTLQDWCNSGYPGIFRTKEFATWVEWGSRTTPIATQAGSGTQINFPSVAGAAKFYGFTQAHDVFGEQMEPDTDWYRARRKGKQDGDDSSQWTGVMVGFFLRPSEAQRLAISGGESIIDLHMTLAYLGEGDEIAQYTGDTDFKLLRGVVASFASEYGEMSASIAGIGRFTSVPEGVPTPVYAAVDCAALPAYRQALVNRLARSGYPPDMTHGFTPHVTLAYIPADAPMPIERVQPVELRFDALTLAIGGRRYAYPLVSSAADAM